MHLSWSMGLLFVGFVLALAYALGIRRKRKKP